MGTDENHDDTLDDISPAEREEMAQRVNELHRLLHPCVVSVRILEMRDGKAFDRSAGSGVLLRLPNGFYVASAWHVVEDLYRGREEGLETILTVGNAILEPPAIVFKHAGNGADAVILRIPEEALTRVGAVPIKTQWPPVPIERDEIVLALGFPRVMRRTADDGWVETPARLLMFTAQQIGDHHLSAMLEIDGALTSGEVLSPDDAEDFAGMSGGPVFAVRLLPGGDAYRLVGLVTDGGRSIAADGSPGVLTGMRVYGLWGIDKV